MCGTENVIAYSNLALATGHVGVEGAGINPLRGQNNVQGACDMGALPDVLSGYQSVQDPAARAKFAAAWGVELHDRPGLTTLGMQRAAREGALRALVLCGQDPAVTDPGQREVQRALRALDCLVVVELFVTETAKYADVVLPAASFAEKDGTFTSTERRVQRVRRAIDPPGACRPDWAILEAIATRLGRPMGFTSADQIFAEVARLTPIYGGMTYARLDEHFGLQWPCWDVTHPGTAVLHRERFARGRGRLIPVGHTPPAEQPDAEYPLWLTTFRLHHVYGSGSMTRRAPLLERENPRGLLWIHPADAAARGVAEGTPGAHPLAARRGDHPRDRVRRRAPGHGGDAVPLRRGAREPGHQRRPRSDLAHARAEGLRGCRGAMPMTALAALPDRAAVDALRRAVARERMLYEVRRDADDGRLARMRSRGALRLGRAASVAVGEAVLLPAARGGAPLGG